jgi:hypothetical protein
MNEVEVVDNKHKELSVGRRQIRAFGELMQVAKVLSNSQMIPTCYQGQPGDIVAALMLGDELGIPSITMLSNSYPVNNKIAFFTDMLMGIIKAHPTYRGFKVIEETAEAFEGEAYRALIGGGVETIKMRFTKEDAVRAGLWNSKDVWRKYPQRMLKHRACSYIARTGWPDVLAGVYTYDELDMDDSRPLRNVSPNPESYEVRDEAQVISIEADLFEEPELLTELVKLAKDANLDGKAVSDIRKRFNTLKDSEKALQVYYDKKKVELEKKVAERLARLGGSSGDQES